MSAPAPPDLRVIRQRIRNSKHVVLALDFDGTLAPIADRPEQAKMPAETAAILRELAGFEHVSIAILSGRSIRDLKSRVDLDVILAGNHGMEIERGGVPFVHPEANALRRRVELACGDLERALEYVPGVFVENKGLTATVHYRLAPSELAGWIEAAVYSAMRRFARRLSVNPARKAWEIRPRIDWNKGSALRLVLRHIGADEPFVICAGDDVDDERMFEASSNSVFIHVGRMGSTNALYGVNSPAELAAFLAALVPCLQNDRAYAESHSIRGASA